MNATVIMVSQGALALGGVIWGSAVVATGTTFTLLGAAVLFLISLALTGTLSINFTGTLNFDPAPVTSFSHKLIYTPQPDWGNVSACRRVGVSAYMPYMPYTPYVPIRPGGSATQDLRPESLKRLEHEYSLREKLDPAWAARPIAIAFHWDRPVLVLEDPCGTPLDQLLAQRLDLGSCLRLAISIATAIG